MGRVMVLSMRTVINHGDGVTVPTRGRREGALAPYGRGGARCGLIGARCCLLLALSCAVLCGERVAVAAGTPLASPDPLARVAVYLAAGDYRRAIEACHAELDSRPSVEGYVYLAYVYQAVEGYLAHLQTQDDWVTVGQVALNLTSRKLIDIIDPPNPMPRMAREMIGEGLRQQFDMVSAMANRLDRARTTELWREQAAWREARPRGWWFGLPPAWAR